MPKAIKYYSDDELDAKIKEIEALKEARAKEREERLTAGKIAYMDYLIATIKTDGNNQKNFVAKIDGLIKTLNPRKDKVKIKGLQEIQNLFPEATAAFYQNQEKGQPMPSGSPSKNGTPISARS